MKEIGFPVRGCLLRARCLLDGHLLGGLVQDLLDEHAGVLLLAVYIRSELVLKTGQ